MNLPSISVVIPAYNCARLLDECLATLRAQNYPQDKLEILIIDGASTDDTRDVALHHGARVLDNPEVIHPKGRPIGIRAATGDLVLALDSDNILQGEDWLRRMVAPFQDPAVAAAEPLYYAARPEDNVITRYCALIGGDDPVVVMLGLNERHSWLTGRWTGTPVRESDQGDWLKVVFTDSGRIPSLGANGFVVRRCLLLAANFSPFHHVDVSHQIIRAGGATWAKVKVGIIHKHGEDIGRFIRKKKRRVERRMDDTVSMGYSYPIETPRLALVLAKAALVLPVLFDTVRGFARKPSSAWLVHPVVLYGVVLLYGWTTLLRKLKKPAGNSYEKV